jgi:hypothetical protein
MSQVGEGLYAYDTSVNSVFDFGGREQCAGTLFAQGIGPMPESDYPCRGANGTLASDDLVANKEAYLQQRIAFYKSTYWWADDDTLRSMAESDYNRYVGLYQKFDAYSPFDDWSITEPDEVGSGRLKGSSYTLTDNNVFNYWARVDSDEELAEEEHFRKQPLYRSVSYALWQDSIDQIKSELYEGHGVSVGVTISDDSLNTDTWSAYDSQFSAGASHVVCIVGWDDGYAASNFTHTTDREGATLWGDEEKAAQLTTSRQRRLDLQEQLGLRDRRGCGRPHGVGRHDQGRPCWRLGHRGRERQAHGLLLPLVLRRNHYRSRELLVPD